VLVVETRGFTPADHEANYSLIHILEGARERERRAQQ
jgi:hypothetical protein